MSLGKFISLSTYSDALYYLLNLAINPFPSTAIIGVSGIVGAW